MDIATIIISAIGGIFIWNIFFSKGKNGSVCEAAIKTNEKPYTNIAPFDPYEVALRLREQFGTTDLQAMFEYFANYSKTQPKNNLVHMAPFDPYEVALRLREQFGTTDLQAMFEYFASKKKIYHPEETLQR